MTRRFIQGFEIDEKGVVIIPSGVAPGYPDPDERPEPPEEE